MATLWSLVSLLVLGLLCPQCHGDSNPCQGMTVADCTISDDNIIAKYPFDAEVCYSMCIKSHNCDTWRASTNDNNGEKECILLKTNYHKDCKTLGGPTLGSIEDCMDVDLTTCSALIWEECSYDGNRLNELEPPAGEVLTISECQAWAQLLPSSVNATHFVYLSRNEECRIYSSLSATSCLTLGGPKSMPSLNECIGDPQCNEPYQVLDDEWRKVKYDINGQTPQYCDNSLASGWYEFQFDHYPSAWIPLSPPAKEFQDDGRTCGTDASSWTPDSLPLLGDPPKDITINFAWDGDDEKWELGAKTVACLKNGFQTYMYQLSAPTNCDLAYCAITS